MEGEKVQQSTPLGQATTGTLEEKPKQNTSLKTLTVILMIITIFSLCLSGYLAYQNYNLRQYIEKMDVSQELQKKEDKVSGSVTPAPESTVEWEEYSNHQYNFSFQHPVDDTIEVSEVETSNYITVRGDGGNYIIKASKDYPPSQPQYYLDTESTGETTVNGIVWKTFFIPKGFNDGHNITQSPLYVVQTEYNNVLYTVHFSHVTEPNEFQNRILSTIRFLE